MNNEMSKSISKLTQLIWGKFGVELNVFSLSNLTEIELQIQKQENPDLYIPLRLGDIYLGTAVALNGNSLESHSKEILIDTVRLILEPLFYDKAQSAVSDRTASSDHSNVVPLFKDTAPPNNDFSIPIPKFVVLKSASKQRARNAAVTIRELLNSWSIINWCDINNTIKNSNDFMAIEGSTIFISSDEGLPSEAELLMLQQNQHCTLVFYSKENSFDNIAPLDKKTSFLFLDLDKILINTHSEFETLSLFFEEALMA
jgi:hypothetical protein